MPDYAEPITRLIDQLKRLPGIGQKSAERMTFHILNSWSKEDTQALAEAMLDMKERVGYCSVCNNITDVDPCHYCSDPARDPTVICVVQQPHNIVAVEKTRQYDGLYHVLLGALSPLSGIGPDQLRIKGLLERLRAGAVEEIILATSPNTEGEATAVYLSKLLKPLGVRVTRIAMGLPVGSDLDYADEVTMSKALEGRREL
jgi:recombination protein RecR